MTAQRIGAGIGSSLTAKGDIQTYTTTPARLAVGADGQTLVADSSTSTGLRYNPTSAAGKNAIINGGMDIWQRGTSNTYVAGPFYTADRFTFNCNIVTSVTVSQITTSDTTNLPNIYNAMRVQRTAGNSSAPLVIIQSTLESKDSYRFAGQNVTFSFWARKGANFSSSTFTTQVITGTGTDQSLVSGFTSGNVVINQNPTLTTTWQRFSYTAVVPSTTTQLGIQFYITCAGTAGAADYFDITGVQLELGSTATTFSRAGGTIGEELALCQRYYYRTATGTALQNIGQGFAKSTTVVLAQVQLPVTMRSNPSATIDVANLAVYNGATSAISSATVTTIATSPNCVTVDCTSTGFIINTPYQLITNTTAAYIGFSAEL